ncbi:MAG TPA: type II secretion system protein [Candidatus Saccharimonadales bacterium]|nr:type II secretion system protein [Candidatus Saccharimonadales bacterium]
MIKRGFTLLEVLVASGVLFIVASAVVGLSNTIIQGTVSNSDRTVVNRWATEGLELTTKIRDDTVLQNKTDAAGNPLWLDQATSVDKYGWYKLQQDPISGIWKLVATPYQVKQPLSAVAGDYAESLTSDQTQAYRLICLESVGAKQIPDNASGDFIYCNAKDSDGTAFNDGDRNVKTDCDTNDVYCLFTKSSLNADNLAATPLRLIPAGNAVKARAVIVWPDKSSYKVSDMATILTNWQGYDH